MYSAPYSCTLTLWSAQKSVSGVPGGYEGRAPRVHHQQRAASPSDAGTLLLPSCDEGLFDLETLVLSVKQSQSYASFHVRGAKADLGLMSHKSSELRRSWFHPKLQRKVASEAYLGFFINATSIFSVSNISPE